MGRTWGLGNTIGPSSDPAPDPDRELYTMGLELARVPETVPLIFVLKFRNQDMFENRHKTMFYLQFA